MHDDDSVRAARSVANDPRILMFGRLLGAANRLEFLLARDLEARTGLSHSVFEMLLLVGRAGARGVAIRDIAQGRVLTSGGATRLVQRALEQGLVTRTPSAEDARVQLIHLTPAGRQALIEAGAVHASNVDELLVSVLPDGQAELFGQMVRTLSEHATRLLPTMP